VAGSKAGAKGANVKAAVAPVAAAPTGPNGAPLYSAAKLLALLHGNKPAEAMAPAPPAPQVSATSLGGQHATSLPSHREHSHQQESIYAASPSPYPQHQAYAQPNPQQYPPQQQFNHQQPPQYFQQPPAVAPSPYPAHQNPYYAGHAGPAPPAPLNIPSYYPPSSADQARRGLSSAPSSDAPPNLHSMDKLSKQQQLQADLAKQIEEKRQLKLKVCHILLLYAFMMLQSQQSNFEFRSKRRKRAQWLAMPKFLAISIRSVAMVAVRRFVMLTDTSSPIARRQSSTRWPIVPPTEVEFRRPAAGISISIRRVRPAVPMSILGNSYGLSRLNRSISIDRTMMHRLQDLH
jgi:hypothetical protein